MPIKRQRTVEDGKLRETLPTSDEGRAQREGTELKRGDTTVADEAKGTRRSSKVLDKALSDKILKAVIIALATGSTAPWWIKGIH
jgi:hypothetical protein